MFLHFVRIFRRVPDFVIDFYLKIWAKIPNFCSFCTYVKPFWPKYALCVPQMILYSHVLVKSRGSYTFPWYSDVSPIFFIVFYLKLCPKIANFGRFWTYVKCFWPKFALGAPQMILCNRVLIKSRGSNTFPGYSDASLIFVSTFI